MLRESNARQGFFEREQYEAVLRHLPEELRPVITFGYLTGWRVNSEVLPLTWAQLDLKAGVVRLEPGTTKNREGREFYFDPADALGQLLQGQRDLTDARQRETNTIIQWVFYRMVAKGRRGPKRAKRITTFGRAWKIACKAAGCPGRIVHDMRRRPSATSFAAASRRAWP
jgi:integrase